MIPKLDPGTQDPIIIEGKSQPDRRKISARWLTGTFLTGITAFGLMGTALFVALDGREILTTPPQLLEQNDLVVVTQDDPDQKGDRVVVTLPKQSFNDRRRFTISTMQRVGDREIISNRPFELLRISLAAEPNENYDYQEFDPLTLFDVEPAQPAENANTQIYSAQPGTDTPLQLLDFTAERKDYDEADIMSDRDVETMIRSRLAVFSRGSFPDAALRYANIVDSSQFPSAFDLADSLDVRIVQENVSVLPKKSLSGNNVSYSEDILAFRTNLKITDELKEAGYQGRDVDLLAETLSEYLGSDTLEAGCMVRLGIESDRNQRAHIIRASIYRDNDHIATFALDDSGSYIIGAEPQMTAAVQTIFEGGVPIIQSSSDSLPTLYDAIYQSSLNYNMNEQAIRRMIQILASNVDMQSHITPSDQLDVFFALPEDGESIDSSEVLYMKAVLGNNNYQYYRYRLPDGTIDYFDENGRSGKRFLLRKPVAKGVFRSPFGPRRHPILGYTRMHSGVDWSAPRGTPILAAGDGVIKEARWSRSYGNHTEIDHGNGFISSYSHQNAFAKGIKPGVQVRQGQVIGYIGSTGLSTGPHLHYEVIVNGTKVDPMRVRMPDNKSLQDEELAKFLEERRRIDEILNSQDDNQVANLSIYQ